MRRFPSAAIAAIAMLCILSLPCWAVTAGRMTYPLFRAFDSSGDFLSGGLLYTYEPGSGTTAAKTTYSDAAATTPLSNPIVLNSLGENEIYVTGPIKLVLKDSDGVTIWTKDSVISPYTPPDLTMLSSYASLAAAVTAIGATPTTLIIDGAATIASGTGVTVPATLDLLFLRSGSITGVAGGGAETLTVNGGVTSEGNSAIFGSSLTVVWNSGTPLRPEWFGVTWDGTTEDTAAWTNTLAALPAAGGEILCPGGKTSLVDSGITCSKSKVRIAAQGAAAIIKLKANATNNSGILHFTGNFDSIENIAFDGNAANQVNDISCIYITGDDCRARDITITSSKYAGIRLNGADRAQIQDINSVTTYAGILAIDSDYGQVNHLINRPESDGNSYGIVAGTLSTPANACNYWTTNDVKNIGSAATKCREAIGLTGSCTGWQNRGTYCIYSTDDGFEVQDSASSCIFVDPYMAYCDEDGGKIDDANGIQVIGGIFEYNNQGTLGVDGGGAGLHTYGACSNIVFNGVVSRNNRGHGFVSGGTTIDFIAKGCIATGNGTGAVADIGCGLRMQGKRFIVLGGIYRANYEHGIAVNGADYGSIVGPICMNNSQGTGNHAGLHFFGGAAAAAANSYHVRVANA
ncbi:MAG: hypothetical protein V2A77_00045, partial [Pseudomonadota bacterium]